MLFPEYSGIRWCFLSERIQVKISYGGFVRDKDDFNCDLSISKHIIPPTQNTTLQNQY